MALDDALPPARLPATPAPGEIARHFPSTYGISVDADTLHLLPARQRVGLHGARLPEPPEAVLIDRVLQLVEAGLLRGVERIVLLPSRGTARYGSYLDGVIRLGVDAASRRVRDPEFGGRYSVFTTTLLHEIGHAVFAAWLSDRQRSDVVDAYLDRLSQRRSPVEEEPTPEAAEHFFVDLVTGALLRVESKSASIREARALLQDLGVPLT
jgi:hypothetical protein